MKKEDLVDILRDKLHPTVLSQLGAALPDDFALADNQNQNQGGLEEIARLKPDVLRNIGVLGGGFSRGEEVMDNQNQNQGKMEELVRMKPAELQAIRTVLLNPGEAVMDNQNQNQGSAAGVLSHKLAKPAE